MTYYDCDGHLWCFDWVAQVKPAVLVSVMHKNGRLFVLYSKPFYTFATFDYVSQNKNSQFALQIKQAAKFSR